MDSKQWSEAADQVLMHTYGRFPVVLERGEGVYLYDLDGKKYLDFGAALPFSRSVTIIRNIMMH